MQFKNLSEKNAKTIQGKMTVVQHSSERKSLKWHVML